MLKPTKTFWGWLTIIAISTFILTVHYLDNPMKPCGWQIGQNIYLNQLERCDQEWMFEHELRHYIYSNIFSKALQQSYCMNIEVDNRFNCWENFATKYY